MNNTTTAPNFADWFHFACGVGTILANLLVLLIAIKLVNFRTKPSQIFVISMTLADLLFGLSYMVSKPFVHQIPTILCGPYYVMLWTCQMSSVFFLLFLNVDKFISIYSPLHYPSIVTDRTVTIQSLLAWVALIVFPIYVYYGSPFLKHTEGDSVNCINVVVPDQLYYAIYTIVCYVCPVLVSVGISGYIFWIATSGGRNQIMLQSARQRKRRKQLFTRILFVFRYKIIQGKVSVNSYLTTGADHVLKASLIGPRKATNQRCRECRRPISDVGAPNCFWILA